jgi:hypothetical protein
MGKISSKPGAAKYPKIKNTAVKSAASAIQRFKGVVAKPTKK